MDRRPEDIETPEKVNDSVEAMKKPYELGILVGRFQTLHSGHEQMVNKALELCEQVGLFIGSSQESGTEKNPFSYETRADMLRAVFGDRVKICPLPDIGVGNNSRWGEYVAKNVYDRFGRYPDLLVSGKESRRVDWFDGVLDGVISELYVPKTIEISASQVRQYFIEDDRETWQQYVNPLLWSRYEEYRRIVLEAKDNKETQSM